METISRISHKCVQGVRLPAIGLGTYELRGQSGRRSIRQAIELGYRHIDTARMYENEREVGQAIAESPVERKDVFLTSKVWHTHLTAKGVEASIDGSLRDLRTDYLDLCLIHWPSPEVPLEETLSALNTARDTGKVRHLGVSNFSPDLMRKALAMAPLICNQVEYHPFKGNYELLALAGLESFFLTAYTPLVNGRVSRDSLLTGIGRKYGKTPAQIALRWLVEQSRVVAIPRSHSRSHLAENIDIFDFQLSADDVEAINALPKG